MTTKAAILQAIRHKCLDCSGGLAGEVRECPITHCLSLLRSYAIRRLFESLGRWEPRGCGTASLPRRVPERG